MKSERSVAALAQSLECGPFIVEAFPTLFVKAQIGRAVFFPDGDELTQVIKF
jgi:hypothetical protein